MLFASLAIVATWIAIHLFGSRVLHLSEIPRSVWLSLAGGASVAYVFVHVLPEIAAAQRTIRGAGVLPTLSHHAWLVALAGLATFYGLERFARRAAARDARSTGTAVATYHVHLGSFALYNLLIAYLLRHRIDSDFDALLTYGLAMGLHLIVIDRGLEAHHAARYRRSGRWVLSAALLSGFALSLGPSLDRAALVAGFAFLGGGVMLNVLKEELPAERESRFWAFGVGAIAYAALLLAI